MKRFRGNYNESKDQAVPFALPALKSYKQNLLFPEAMRAKGLSDSIFFEVLNDKIASPSKVKKENSMKPPNSRVSPYRGTNQMRPMLPNKNNLTQGKLPSKKPSISSKNIHEPKSPLRTGKKTTDPLNRTGFSNRTISDSLKTHKKPNDPLNQTEGFQKPHAEPQKSPKKPLKKPITAKVPIRNLASVPRYKTPQSYQGENLRSNSLSSSTSLNQNLLPRTPQINSISSKRGLYEGTLTSEIIPEYSSKRPPRVSETRSISRKRPKKRKEKSFFDIDFGPFKMSDLSIYPLL